MTEMTSLEVFEIVEKHLLAQNERSMDLHSGKCMYYDDYGLKCAIGCLISEDVYSPEMESKNILLDKTIRDGLEKSLGFKPSSGLLRLLDSLQKIHDETSVCCWAEELMTLRADVERGRYD